MEMEMVMEVEKENEVKEYDDRFLYADISQDQATMEEPSEILQENCNGSESLVEEENQLEEDEKLEYKTHHIDGETMIKGELKQLIFTKVSEETSAKVLKDISYEQEKQFAYFQEKSDMLLNRNKELSCKVEADNYSLTESESLLMEANEMIGLMQEKLEKLESILKQSPIESSLEKSGQQKHNVDLLKNSCDSKFKKQIQTIKESLNITEERKFFLKSELEYRHATFQEATKRCDEIRQIILSYDQEIEKSKNNKQVLEQKLIDIHERSKTFTDAWEKDIVKQVHLLNNLKAKDESLSARFNSKIKQKLEMEKLLEDRNQKLDSMKTELAGLQKEIEEKTLDLSELKKQSNEKITKYDKTINEIKQNRDGLCEKLEQLIANISAVTASNTDLQNEINGLQMCYLIKEEDKLVSKKKFLEQQNKIRDLEAELDHIEMENAQKKRQLLELQSECESSQATLSSIDDDILKEQEDNRTLLTTFEKEYEKLKAQDNKHLSEASLKKNYLLSVANSLKERLNNLKQIVTPVEKTCENVEEEIRTLSNLVKQKQTICTGLQEKLKMLGKPKIDTPLKSVMKSSNKGNVTKNVKFNDTLFFKEASEHSDTSSMNESMDAPKSLYKYNESKFKENEYP